MSKRIEAILFGLTVSFLILVALLIEIDVRERTLSVLEPTETSYKVESTTSIPSVSSRAILAPYTPPRASATTTRVYAKPSDVETRVKAKLAELGRSDLEVLALRIARCESTMNPNAVNGVAVGSEHASGLFQFLPSTFKSVSNGNIWNVEDQTEAFVKMVEAGRIREWACK